MDIWTVIRIVTQIVACLMMLGGVTLLCAGLKKDDWKTSVKGLFICMMGIFGLLMIVIANLTGK